MLDFLALTVYIVAVVTTPEGMIPVKDDSKQERNRSLLIIIVFAAALGAVWLLLNWSHRSFLDEYTSVEPVNVRSVELVLAKSDVWTYHVPHVFTVNGEQIDIAEDIGTDIDELKKIFTPGQHYLEVSGRKDHWLYHREIAAVLDP